MANATSALAFDASIGPGGIEITNRPDAHAAAAQLQSDQVELKYVLPCVVAGCRVASIGPGGIEIDIERLKERILERLQSDQVELK